MVFSELTVSKHTLKLADLTSEERDLTETPNLDSFSNNVSSWISFSDPSFPSASRETTLMTTEQGSDL